MECIEFEHIKEEAFKSEEIETKTSRLEGIKAKSIKFGHFEVKVFLFE